jgi:cyclopropane fatty-acyl-phospholipid synthase-like methyltransferase
MNEQEQMKFFYKIFDAGLTRLGPGEDDSTKKALDTLLSYRVGHCDKSLEATRLRILDLGCGNGAQTIQLAKQANCTILAVDNHKPYLDELRHRAEFEGVSDKIQTRLGDMCNVSLEIGPFDIVWSEGALYSMGFLNGLKTYHAQLVPDGLFAVSELCWFDGDVPDECRQFFANEYPAMTTVESNLDAIKELNYEVLEHFALSESAWWEYYHPLEKRLEEFRDEYSDDPGKIAIVDSCQMEIDFYRKYSAYYGYVFFLLRRCA